MSAENESICNARSCQEICNYNLPVKITPEVTLSVSCVCTKAHTVLSLHQWNISWSALTCTNGSQPRRVALTPLRLSRSDNRSQLHLIMPQKYFIDRTKLMSGRCIQDVTPKRVLDLLLLRAKWAMCEICFH